MDRAVIPARRGVVVGRLVPLKGQRRLLEIMPVLLEQFPNLHLTILGDGPLHGELRRRVDALGLDGHVEMPGAVDDVGAWLALADVFVSCSESEGMPVALLEAMAWQLPVVASDIAGNRSVVEAGKTGYLYPLEDGAQPAAILAEVLQNRAAAVSVARRARAMVSAEYSASVCAQAHANLYQSLLG